MEKKVSIVVITKDTKELLKRLLDSIFSDRSLLDIGLEVIVVDNGSKDGTEKMVKSLFPNVIFFQNERNLGFSCAANRGFSLSHGKYVLFLNSDTLVLPGEIVRMIDFMDGNEDVALIGPQLLYEDLRLQRSFSYIPGILFEIFPKPFLRLILPSRYRDEKGGLLEPIDVDSLIGAALLVRRDVFDRLQGFDERFFFFLEETDLCYRARKMGYRVVFFPGSKIIHLQGGTVRKSWVLGRIEYNISLYRFIRKHRSFFYFLIFVSIRLLKNLLSLSIYTLFFPVLLSSKMRLKYNYRVRLLLWHLLGFSQNFGLKGKD